MNMEFKKNEDSEREGMKSCPSCLRLSVLCTNQKASIFEALACKPSCYSKKYTFGMSVHLFVSLPTLPSLFLPHLSSLFFLLCVSPD